MTRLARRLAALLILSALLVPLAAVPVAAQESDRDDDGLRDRLEERWGLTSPDDPDSDGDGLPDAAEDHDGDRLSALGEQRFGTDPSNPDTDGDGILDGDEDSDGDGVNDARQQDQRRVPAKLRPEPKVAFWDRPASYDDKCHSEQEDPVLRTCTFGDPEGERTVALFGDSHALQWLPSITGPAEEAGWRVVTLTKAACPPHRILSGRKRDGAQASCDRWRARALRWITQNEPDLLLMGAAARKYNLLDDDGVRYEDEARTREWLRGLRAVLAELPPSVHPAVLADTPYLRARNPVSCLRDDRRDLSACGTLRSQAIDRAFDRAERDVAEAAGGSYVDLTDLVCPYSPCPAVIGDVLLYRNPDHITATYAEMLAPSMGAAIEGVFQTIDARAGRIDAPVELDAVDPAAGTAATDEDAGRDAPVEPADAVSG
jgi:hypothetical protein